MILEDLEYAIIVIIISIDSENCQPNSEPLPNTGQVIDTQSYLGTIMAENLDMNTA